MSDTITTGAIDEIAFECRNDPEFLGTQVEVLARGLNPALRGLFLLSLSEDEQARDTAREALRLSLSTFKPECSSLADLVRHYRRTTALTAPLPYSKGRDGLERVLDALESDLCSQAR